nr:MDR family MFS transporter [Oceanobacillus sp. CFH 90083]
MQEMQREKKQFNVIPIMTSLLIAGFIGLFFETALNMAFSDLMQVFDITPATVQWLTTGYLLTIGILVPVSALLMQWFPTRTLFIASVFFSILGTASAAIAPSFNMLLVARVLQAIGTGLLLPLMYHVVLVIIPAKKRGTAMGLIGLVMMTSLALGPTISGLVIEKLSYQWLFWLAIPFYMIALLCGVFYMQNVSAISKPKIDILSILFSTAGFGGVVYGFSGIGKDENTVIVIVTLSIGILSLLLFAFRQFSIPSPMVNLRAFKQPMFALGTVMVGINMIIILTANLLLPIYLQDGMAFTALLAGLILLPGGILNGIMSPINGRLFDRFGPKWLVLLGFIISLIALWAFSKIQSGTSVEIIIGVYMCLMVGTSMVMMPAQTNGLNQLEAELYPHGSAIVNTIQQVSGALGTAGAATMMTLGQQNYLSAVDNPAKLENITASLTAGVQNAFIFAMFAAIIGFVLALFIKRVQVEE